MNPRTSKAGKSFKGIAQYMSHDKDGATTSERLGFVAYVNMPMSPTGDGPRDASRAANVMAFTALHWEELQRAHHGATDRSGKAYRRPSRPPEKPVYSYSLRFHPDDLEKVTPALLRKAALESLDVLGLSEHQALIFEHTDFTPSAQYPKHPSHVHVVVNKIHPVTGRTANLQNDQLKLSVFAEAFGRKHRLKPVEKRLVNNARRDKGEIVFYRGIPRADYERFKTLEADYRGQGKERVMRLRNEQQARDRKQLDERITASRQVFETRLQKTYEPSMAYFTAKLEQHQRTITLDHLGSVFRVLVRVKQRVTGELKREREIVAGLNRSLSELSTRRDADKTAHEAMLSRDRDQLVAVHAAQLRRDAEYFDYLDGRTQRESAGEAGRKGFNWRSTGKLTRPPAGSRAAALLAARKQDSQDAAPTRLRADASEIAKAVKAVYDRIQPEKPEAPPRAKRYRGKRKADHAPDDTPKRRR